MSVELFEQSPYGEVGPQPGDMVAGIDFAAIEAQLDNIDIEQIAKDAFDGILTFETETPQEAPRTIEDIKSDILTIVSNPMFVELDSAMDYAAMEFAKFCNHNHINAQSLGGLEQFAEMGHNLLSDHHTDHDQEISASSLDDDDDDEEEE